MNQSDAGKASAGDVTADQASSQKIWKRQFEREQPLLRRMASGMGLPEADVDDVLQEVYLAALERPAKCRGANEARIWLIWVTMNHCMIEFRRRKQFPRKAQEILGRRAR